MQARVRDAVEADLPLLGAVERAAGEAFREVGMDKVADDEPLRPDELRHYLRSGYALVADDAGGLPVAYLVAEVVDDAVHVEQVSVHPAAARRGIGRALIEHLAERVRGEGRAALTLTTFTEVAWNAPYYRRLGFAVLADDAVGPGLRAIRRQEAADGLDRWPRVCMRRPV